MARRVARGRFIRPAPKTKIWIAAAITETNVPGASAVLAGLLNSDAQLLRPFTILRTRILVDWASDQLGANEVPVGAFGAVQVTEQAGTIGITAIPDPVSDAEGDWFVYQPLIERFSFVTAAGFQSNNGRQYVIDSKAMRKIGPNQQVAFVAANRTASVGAEITIEGRMLLQLH